MLIANTGFIFFAFWDASRRIQLMRYMSNSLELDFKLKNKVTVRLPTLNFVDRQSLVTWLEARRLVLDTGKRFTTRIHYYVTYYLLICACMLLFIFAIVTTLIHHENLNLAQWVSFGLSTTVLTISMLLVLVPTSYLNTEMEHQIKRLI